MRYKLLVKMNELKAKMPSKIIRKSCQIKLTDQEYIYTYVCMLPIITNLCLFKSE